MNYKFVPVAHLEVGDMVDLEGDPYADPNRDHPALGFEHATVVQVERETFDCVAVMFEGFDVVGFPSDHRVAVVAQW